MRSRMLRFALCVLTIGCAGAALAAAPAGLVGFWRFDEGSGAVARDSSGKNHHGEIVGAAFVKRDKAYALRFNGEAGFVEVSAQPNLDIGSAGTISLWFKSDQVDGGLFSWGAHDAGLRNLFALAFDSRTPWGTPGYELRLWMGNGRDRYSEHIADPRKGDWNHIAFTIDARRVTCFRDGAPDTATSLPVPININNVPFVIGKFAQGQGGRSVFRGLIDEVRLYNRPLSVGEVLADYKQDAASFGKDASLFDRPQLRVELLPDPGRVVVRARCALMAPLPEGAILDVGLSRGDSENPVASQKQQITRGLDAREMILNLDAAELAPGPYQVGAVVRKTNGEPFGNPSVESVQWPGQTEVFKNVKVLNNLVWELLNKKPGAISGVKEYKFIQPKRRWVYVACTASAPGGKVSVSIDGSPETQDIIVFDRVAETQKETMRFLAAGEQTLALRAEGKGRIDRLIVRSIPELVFASLFSAPHMAPHGPYDAAFMKKYVVPNVNTFVSGRTEHPLFKELQGRGIRFLAHCNAPPTTRDGKPSLARDGKPITVQQAYDYLASTLGMTHPKVDGVIIDEFGGSDPHCAVYAEAWRRLHADPTFADKLCVPYADRLFLGPEGRELVKAIVDTGSSIAFKRYLRIRHDEQAARDYAFRYAIGDSFPKYRDLCPGSIEHITVCFGYFSAPYEFLNIVPQANYKTYLDMQFNLIANAPECWGTYGLMTYLASYADEETIRWGARLFRHYGIEGKTERASADPFDDSRLLANGDFTDDTRHWKLSPAEPNSIRRVRHESLGWLQGRYQRTPEGDTALLMVRSAKKPNSISQQIRNLEPGRTYTFRMITGQYDDMTKKEKHAVSIKLDGAQIIPEQSFSYIFPNCYGHFYGQYDSREHRAWMNYHWILFRAKSPTAKLTVSDWQSEEEPGGPIGQGLMFNFLQVHPCLER